MHSALLLLMFFWSHPIVHGSLQGTTYSIQKINKSETPQDYILQVKFVFSHEKNIFFFMSYLISIHFTWQRWCQ